MATVNGPHGPMPVISPIINRPNNEPTTNNTFLLDPASSPRLKAITVAMSAWCELHLLGLRAHDLLSSAHLNRIEHVPIGLYHLFETLRTFEKRYSQMLVKVNQYPDPAHIVFFAKTFSERIFHAGETIETLLSPNLARSAQTRAEFRHQLQETEISLQDFESSVYENIAGANFTRSKVQKVFLPQPHPLEFIPVAIEPQSSFFNTSSRPTSSPESSGLFSTSFVFLRNHRRQLLSSMQTLNESRFQSDFAQLDVRDFHHEVDIVEAEIALVTNLQRILTTVRMMEEVRATGGTPPTMSSLSDNNNMAAMFRETIELFQPTRREPLPSNTPAGSRIHMSSSFYGIPRSNTNNNYREDSGRSSAVDRNLGFTSLSSANSNDANNSNTSNHNVHSHRRRGIPINIEPLQPLPPSRLSEPMTHSWMLPGEREREREIERDREDYRNSSVQASRGRWFTTDQLAHSNLHHASRQPAPAPAGRWNDTTDYLPLGEDFTGRDGPSSRNNNNTGNVGSAFTRVQRNISTAPPHMRSRASSVAEQSDFGSHINNETELNFDGTDQLFAQNIVAGFDRQNALLQDLTTRVVHLGIATRHNTGVVSRNNSHLTDLVIAMDELTRNVAKIQEDVAILKANDILHSSNTGSSEHSYHIGVHIPTRNRTDDNWRNIDTSSSSRIDRMGTNMLNRSWESSSRSSVSGIRGEPLTATFREPIMDNNTPSHHRFNFSTALTAAERRVASASSANTPPTNSEQQQHFADANGSNNHFMLNNQIPPGNRANNYWDNFKSYSRLNLLSDSKTNIPVLSPSCGAEEQVTNSIHDDGVFRTGSPSLRRDSRGERPPPGASSNRASLSANFVENIGQKKRNKDQKKQFSTVAPISPLHTSSSNSSPGGSLNDLIVRGRLSNVDSHDTHRNPRDVENHHQPSTFPPGPSRREQAAVSVPHSVDEPPMDTGGDRIRHNPTASSQQTIQAPSLPVMSPPSSLEVDLVSRDEFLQLNSGAGSSASGNGKSDDGGPSSSSSKRELEKLLASPDHEEFASRRRRQSSGEDHGNWQFDLDHEIRNNAAAARPAEPDWSVWPGSSSGGGAGGGGEERNHSASASGHHHQQQQHGKEEEKEVEQGEGGIKKASSRGDLDRKE